MPKTSIMCRVFFKKSEETGYVEEKIINVRPKKLTPPDEQYLNYMKTRQWQRVLWTDESKFERFASNCH